MSKFTHPKWFHAFHVLVFLFSNHMTHGTAAYLTIRLIKEKNLILCNIHMYTCVILKFLDVRQPKKKIS